MKIFVSGVHGIGKTTLVNNVSVKSPLIKITNSDIIPFSGVGFKQQMYRADLMLDILDHLPNSVNVLMDRSPLDFIVYNHAVVDANSVEYKIAHDVWEALKYRYKMCGAAMTIVVTDSMKNIMERIKKRGRDGMNEENEEFTRNIRERFGSFKFYTGVDPVRMPLKDAQKYIERLLDAY